MSRAIYLRVGNMNEPQPGFFPFVAGFLLTIFSIILLILSLKKQDFGNRVSGTLVRPIVIMAGMVAYAVILNSVGYVFATIILSSIILLTLGTRPWFFVVVISIILTVSCYFIFDRLLGISLPKGIAIPF
jgi:putative tricarboxylic transport membrane protein